MSRTTHHVPWRLRTDACPHNGDAFRRYPHCCAVLTEHSLTTRRRPRGGAGATEVVEVTTSFAGYSYQRAFGHTRAAAARRAWGQATVRTSVRATTTRLRAVANGALADDDWDALADLDGWVAPARRFHW